jgi:hypothetical protein
VTSEEQQFDMTVLGINDREFESCLLMGQAACRVLNLNPGNVAMISISPTAIAASVYRLDDAGQRFWEWHDPATGTWARLDEAAPLAMNAEPDIRIATHTFSYTRKPVVAP